MPPRGGEAFSPAGLRQWGSQESLCETMPGEIDPAGTDWYRIADGFLGLDCDHGPVTERWREIYHDCRCAGPSAGLPSLLCVLRTQGSPDTARLDCDEDGTIDPVEFNLRLLPDQRFLEVPSPLPGWRFLARIDTPDLPFAGFRGRTVILDRAQPWEHFVAHYTLHRLLRLQRNTMVFHASAASVNGSGVMLAGPKLAGKTTLSLALAALGHAFFGDEFAAVRRDSWELIPFRRSVSIRPGPAAAPVAAALNSGKYSAEPYPDGTPRFRIPASDLVEGVPAAPTPLRAIFFLRPFAERPRVTPFQAGLEHVRLLSPLGSTVADFAPAQTISDFFHLLKRARCYFLEPGGSPRDTAEAIVRALEAA
jgi:hypothetical protein